MKGKNYVTIIERSYKMKRIIILFLVLTIFVQVLQPSVFAMNTDNNRFRLLQTQEIADFGGIAYYYEHIKTGAKVLYVDNDSINREFSICFKTPSTDSMGANHVLEHAVLCGSEKYPTKNIMNYIEAGTLASVINAKTFDDYTYYEIKTQNETEYYNLMDIYLNGVFHPLFLSDENVFRQQGIRLEYVDGKVQYNGVVYNELNLKSLDTTENSLSFLSDKLYTNIYGQTSPAFSSGGTVNEIKNLTYNDLLNVYKKYYLPSNSITYLSGKQDIEKTLKILDEVFDEFTSQDISINFTDTKTLPTKKIYEYNIDENTKTVDIGFMSSGIMMNEADYIRYARAMLEKIIVTIQSSILRLYYVLMEVKKKLLRL